MVEERKFSLPQLSPLFSPSLFPHPSNWASVARCFLHKETLLPEDSQCEGSANILKAYLWD